jgi:hypothetical protein
MSTWPQLNAWAETTPVSDPNPGWRGAVVGDPCAICGDPLAAGERCYAVVELDEIDNRQQWVCPKHVEQRPST